MSHFPVARPPRSGTPLTRKTTLPPLPGAHVFHPSGQFVPTGKVNEAGAEICAACDNTRWSRLHDVPPTPTDAAEVDARILGEGADDDR